LARHLIGLCDVDELPRLRVGNPRPAGRWHAGRINLGLGHGLPGVLAALIAAHRAPSHQADGPHLGAHPDPERDSDRPSGPGPDTAEAIGRVAAYLVRHGRRGERGIVCWPFAAAPSEPSAAAPSEPSAAAPSEPLVAAPHADGPSAAMQWRRQAWCYGTPGVAWQLTEAGHVLGDAGLRDFGLAAMASLCAAWDDDHLDTTSASDRLAFCHGAAGVLAVADAFALHTGLEPANRLAEHLQALLLAELSGVADLAEENLSLPSGATGILAVLLGRDPHRRGWLRTVGLR
jgi:hypothetical protein